MMLFSLLASLPGSVTPAFGPAQDLPPNVLVVIADDFGVDLMGSYGVAAAPCTPMLDGLAADGMLFRNAWTNPVCTPTRAALLTGRYGFRTGIGTVGGGGRLPLSETTLAEGLRDSAAGYATAAFGKWHLGGNGPGAASHPNDSGFQHYAGSLGGAVPDYAAWTKTVDGVTSPQPVTTYVTVDTTDDALAAIVGLPEPWFVYVAYNAPHTPFHAPPANLCPPSGACPNAACGNLGPNPSPAEQVRAMVEVMDHQLGRLLEAVDAEDTLVLFMGDNGTAGQAVQAPFSSGEAKGSIFQGGVNVPFIVRGPGVVASETDALVGLNDVFATVGELTGSGLTAEDSVSFAAVLGDPGARPRTTVYTERFEPNGASLPIADHDYAVRDERFKLVVRPNQADALFDLLADPYEDLDLLPAGGPETLGAYDRLRAEVEVLQTGAALVGLPASASLAGAGAQQLVLSPGQPFAGDLHLVVGSASGTAPGILVDGLLVPLNVDGYTMLSLGQANGAVFQGTLGVVSDQGTGQAAIAVPAGLHASLAGTLLHHGYLVLDAGTATVVDVGPPVPLALVP